MPGAFSLLDFAVHGGLAELAGRVERIVPIADERGAPFRIETPQGKAGTGYAIADMHASFLGIA